MPGNAGGRVDYCRYSVLVPGNLGRLIDLLPTKTVDAWEYWLTCRLLSIRRVGA
jgi:hypothetical protein